MVTQEAAGGVRRGRLRRWAAVLGMGGIAAVAGWLATGRDGWPAKAVVRSPQTSPMAFSRDGGMMATWTRGLITVWDVADGRKRVSWPISARPTHFGAFAPDGATFTLVVGHAIPGPLTVQRYDLASGLRVSSRDMEPFDPRHTVLYDLNFTPDGGGLRATLGDADGIDEVVTWDVETGGVEEERPLSCPAPPGIRDFSRDGRYMAFAQPGSDTVTVWRLDEDRIFAVSGTDAPDDTPAPGRAVSHLAFSPDGSTLVVSREGGEAKLWGLESPDSPQVLDVHTWGYSANDVQFSADGATTVSLDWSWRPASAIERLRAGLRNLWYGGKPHQMRTEGVVIDVASARLLGRLKSAAVARLSDDGRTVATYEEDRAVRLRDVPHPSASMPVLTSQNPHKTVRLEGVSP